VKRGTRSVIALAVATAGAARAQTPPVVRVFVSGSPDAVSGTRDALRDRCARPSLEVIVEDAATVTGEQPAANTWSAAPADAEPSAADTPDAAKADTATREAAALGAGRPTDLAVGYVELAPETGARIVVVDGRTQAPLERRALDPEPSLEMSLEAVAQVICTTIDSTLAARAPAPATNPPPPPLAAPPPLAPPRTAEPDRSTFLGWAGVFGAGSDYGLGFRGGAGGLFGATLGSRRWRASLLTTATYFPATAVDRQGAAATLGLFGARLMPAAAFRASTDIETVVGLGGGIDWFRMSPGKPPPGGSAESDVGSVDPVLSALLAARLSVSAHFGFWLAAGVDFDLNTHRYVNAASGEPQVFFEPPRVRGSGQAGLAVTFGHDAVQTQRAPAKAGDVR
jgi:hypothetical protein